MDIQGSPTHVSKKWVSSTNLDKPKVESKTIKATEWRKEIKVPQGYYLDKDSVYEGINNYGYPFRTYRLIRLTKWSEIYAKRKSTETMSILRE